MIIVTPAAWVIAYVQIVEHHNPRGWVWVAFGALYFVVGMVHVIRD